MISLIITVYYSIIHSGNGDDGDVNHHIHVYIYIDIYDNHKRHDLKSYHRVVMKW